jgi:hypothetical protein
MAAQHALCAAKPPSPASPRARAAAASATASATASGAAPSSSSALTLWIGNKKYSSWSLRPWLFLRHHGIPFEEERVPLGHEATRLAHLGGASPTGLVPVLVHAPAGVLVWDSLAILEYLAGACGSGCMRCMPLKRSARVPCR